METTKHLPKSSLACANKHKVLIKPQQKIKIEKSPLKAVKDFEVHKHRRWFTNLIFNFVDDVSLLVLFSTSTFFVPFLASVKRKYFPVSELNFSSSDIA
jgi:hypothetical protein